MIVKPVAAPTPMPAAIVKSTSIFFASLQGFFVFHCCDIIISYRSLHISCRCFDFSRFYQMTPATLRYVNTIPPTAATAAILNNTICISLLSFGFVPLAVFT